MDYVYIEVGVGYRIRIPSSRARPKAEGVGYRIHVRWKVLAVGYTFEGVGYSIHVGPLQPS